MKNSFIGKTASYTICKNEIKHLDTWLYYADKNTDFQVILDTGSTDGTWERLQEAKKEYPNLIIEQKIWDDWKFDVARRYNLDMVPNDVSWCMSPDLDEWFSINVLSQLEATIRNNPEVTNVSCDRLDIYSEVVRVGPPAMLGTNKIHRRHDYTWVQPIYEHLFWKHKDRSEVEVYNPEIYLVHNQDFKKKSRPELYKKMLLEEYTRNPTNGWTLWFLVNEYYRERDIVNFVKTGCDYVKCAKDVEKRNEVLRELRNIYMYHEDTDLRYCIMSSGVLNSL